MTDTDTKQLTIARGFMNGLRAGAPIAVGYIPSAMAFGILARTANMTAWETLFMSYVVFAGASQFVAVNLYMLGAAFPEIILATLVLNMRLIMMSSAISKRLLPGIGRLTKAWIGFELTDESFSVSAMRGEDMLSADFQVGVNFLGHWTWAIGSLLGWFGAAILPSSVQDSMGIALYALFIGLLVPSVRKNRSGLVVAAAAMALSAFIKWTPCLNASLNRGFAIMLAAGAAALFGAIALPVKGDGSR